MAAVTFEYQQPVLPPDVNRMDIVCFIGFVPLRDQPLPTALQDWLGEHGWSERLEAASGTVLDVPLPIGSWDLFDQVFAHDHRLTGAAAVRGEGLASQVTIEPTDRPFTIVVDGVEHTVTMVHGQYSPLELSTNLGEALNRVPAVRVQTEADRKFLVIERRDETTSGTITVHANPTLGFSATVNDTGVALHGGELPDEVAIGGDDNRFTIGFTHGESAVTNEHTVTIEPGLYSPADLAERIRQALDSVPAVTIATLGDWAFLEIKRKDAKNPGAITVFANAALGFPNAANDSNSVAQSYLGAAVRAFFDSGGRKCYVIRMGDPPPLDARDAARVQQLGWLLSGTSDMWPATAELADLSSRIDLKLPPPVAPQADWHGLAHLYGLDDVAHVCLPDLPELVSETPDTRPQQDVRWEGEEVFVECAPDTAESPDLGILGIAAPRCSAGGYAAWGRVLEALISSLPRISRETHLLAAVPLPTAELGSDFAAFADDQWFGEQPKGPAIRSAFLQLVYPWVRSPATLRLPGAIGPADGYLAGLVAAGTLANGAFRSAAGASPPLVTELEPASLDLPLRGSSVHQSLSLIERTPRGVQLTADATTSADPNYRPAAVSRLIALILRAARHQGHASVFEPSGPRLWRDIELGLSALLTAVYENGGLRGPSLADAFTVTCDRSTMTQSDIDAGRMIATVSVLPAVPVEQINVTMTLSDGGASLSGVRP